MNSKSFSSLILTALLLFVFFEMGVCRERRSLLADDVKEIPIVEGGEQEELARYAIDEHNKKANTHIEYVKLVCVKEQVVDGKMYYLSFEGTDAGKTKIYEAIVLLIPWKDNFKQVEVFKELEEGQVGAPEQNPFSIQT